MVVSPLTGTDKVSLVKSIPVSELKRIYADVFQIDLTYLFKELEIIELYLCTETGYHFFYPLSIAGDDRFYQHFGNLKWYYDTWKWEHNECSLYVSNENSVLEIGAGKGAFLDGLRKRKKVSAIGLELNSQAVAEAQSRGINLVTEDVQAHARTNEGAYDMVCSFQVLEHIADVGEVIDAMVKCLKPGGLLILSVPNNDSFIKNNPLASRVINMPPHHMGLWDRRSLEGLALRYPLELVETKLEPLQPANRDTYIYTKMTRIFRWDIPVRVFWKLKLHFLLRPLVNMFANRIAGHTIMVIFKKLGTKSL